MNRMPLPRDRGKRELIYIALLVIPLVVAGFYFAATDVLIEPVPTSVPTEVGTDATPETTPAASPAAFPDATP